MKRFLTSFLDEENLFFLSLGKDEDIPLSKLSLRPKLLSNNDTVVHEQGKLQHGEERQHIQFRREVGF